MASILKSFSLNKTASPGKTPDDSSEALAEPSAQSETPQQVQPQSGSVRVLKATTDSEPPNKTDSQATPIASRGVAAKISGAVIGKPNGGADGLVEFNLDDIVEKGREQIDQVRSEAEVMLKEARAEAERIKKAAQEQGHAEGIQAAAAEVEQRIAKEAEVKAKAQIASLHNAVLQMRNHYNEWMAQYADVMTSTALAAAERLTRQKICLPNASLLAVEPDPGSLGNEIAEATTGDHLLVRWAREALHSTRSAGKLILAVHPDTLAELGKQFDELLANPDLPEQAMVIPDETLTVGDVVVRQDGGEIRAGLDAQLQRLREELMGDEFADDSEGSR